MKYKQGFRRNVELLLWKWKDNDSGKTPIIMFEFFFSKSEKPNV